MALPEFDPEEVAKHNKKNDLWVIIHDGVYDVTKYLSEHPGGEIPLLQVAGEDGTEEFEDNGHSEDARKLMVDFQIGVVRGTQKKSCKCWFANHLPLTTVALGALIVGIAYYRYKNVN